MLGATPHFCCMACSPDAQIATGIGTWIAHVSGSSRFEYRYIVANDVVIPP